MKQISCLRSFLMALGLGSLALNGCGSSSPVRAGSISATDPNSAVAGQLTSLGVGKTARLTMSPIGDAAGAGVDWIVTCGGSPVNGSVAGGACGELSPAHTSDTGATAYTAPALVPYLTSVTITAAVTNSPGASTTLTLPIVALPISVILTTPPPASLIVGQTFAVGVAVLNDTASAGVKWSATCGSADCGTFNKPTTTNPNYTAPAAVPTGGTVTLTATSVADPTKSIASSVAIVLSTQLGVTINSTIPVVLVESSKTSLTAVVSNDPAKVGVDWTVTCGSAPACGAFSLSPAHTASGGAIVYTAPPAVPSGNTVTITASATAASATNPAKPFLATTTIVAAAPAIKLTLAPSATVTATTRVPLSATVTNDITPGGISWSVQCAATDPGACGYVTPAQTADGAAASYVAPPTPPSSKVMVVATSTAFPALVAPPAQVTIAPYTALSVNFIPFAPAQVTPASTITLTAAVTNDTTNAGVDWQVCASGCGFFTTQAAVPEIPATPTMPLVPAVPAVTSTSVQGWPNGLPIPYTAPNSVPQSGLVAIAATAHVDTNVAVAANVVVTNALTGPSLPGVVQAGTQPVIGAQVSLYAAGVTGYASLASLLAVPGSVSSATTGTDGSFTLPAGYVCPSGGQVYLVATGGKVGSNAANPNLSMMTALGPCSNLGATPVVINEITTVGSVWPLAQFSTNQPLTGLSGYLNLGTSSTNTVGLARAFAMVNNLVDVTTGQARYNVPTGNAAVPYVEINTIADALNACTATAGGQNGDGSPCGKLFAATAPLYSQGTVFNSLAPTDTTQAAFNAAQHSGAFNVAYNISQSGVYGLASVASPFQPVFISAPQDLGISLHYTSGGGLTSASGASAIAIDAADNVWLTAQLANRVIELNSTGAAISPPGGYTAGGLKNPTSIAIDTSNNIWIVNSDSLTELNSFGAAGQGSPFYGVTNGLNMSIDGHDNIWITNPDGVAEYNNLGIELSPVGGYVNAGVGRISEITIDSMNNVWLGYDDPTGGFRLAELSDSNGQLVVSASINSSQPQSPLVADSSGDIWSTPANNLYKLPPYNGQTSDDYVPTPYAGNNGSQNTAFASIFKANGIALDGGNDLWVANTGDSANVPNLTGIPLNVLSSAIAGQLNSSALGVGTLQVAPDGAGNVWVLLSDSSLTEFVGVAVPTTTPLAAAIAKKKVGKTP